MEDNPIVQKKGHNCLVTVNAILISISLKVIILASTLARHNLAEADVFNSNNLAVCARRMDILTDWYIRLNLIKSLNPLMMLLRKAVSYMNNEYLITNQRNNNRPNSYQVIRWSTLSTATGRWTKYNKTSKSHLMKAFSTYVNYKILKGGSYW